MRSWLLVMVLNIIKHAVKVFSIGLTMIMFNKNNYINGIKKNVRF